MIARSVGGQGMIFRRGEPCARLEIIRMTGKEWHTSQQQVHAKLRGRLPVQSTIRMERLGLHQFTNGRRAHE